MSTWAVYLWIKGMRVFVKATDPEGAVLKAVAGLPPEHAAGYEGVATVMLAP